MNRLCACLSLALLFSLASCSSDSSVAQRRADAFVLRIYESPYAGVDWNLDAALKSQHHDHVGTKADRILAYDAAGYDVVALMDYSGNPTADFSLRARLWPPEAVLPGTLLSQLKNIDVLIPGAEEIGFADHVTSPFLTTYLEVAPASSLSVAAWQYASLGELLAKIRDNGGMRCLAHPWYGDLVQYAKDVDCVEVYSAYAEAMRAAGRTDFTAFDRNELLVQRWNAVLDVNQHVVGIAVNDHTGPYIKDGAIASSIRDSGKIIVMAKQRTLESYREAFGRGAVIAIRDNGVVKDSYPKIQSITVDESGIAIDVSGEVTWVARAGVIGRERILANRSLPANARWVRAEIRGGDQTVLYTQAFVVRPVGDTDGDYDIDQADAELCRRPPGELSALQAQACVAAQVTGN